MMPVILQMLKFGLLLLLYLFILRIFYFILSDLRRTSAKTGIVRGKERPRDGAELVVTESADHAVGHGDTFKIDGQITIGRGGNNLIRINDSFVSHNHAKIIFSDGQYFLEDLDSINGTYINGVRLNGRVPLTHGDVIRIAGVTFKFVRWAYEVE